MVETLKLIDGLVESILTLRSDISDELECAIQCLDCGPATERTIPDVIGALEALREIEKRLIR